MLIIVSSSLLSYMYNEFSSLTGVWWVYNNICTKSFYVNMHVSAILSVVQNVTNTNKLHRSHLHSHFISPSAKHSPLVFACIVL